MATKKSGLGKRLDEILNVPPSSRGGLENLIPTGTPPTDYEPEDLEDYVLIPRTKDPLKSPGGPYPSVDDDQFEPYFVERVVPDDDPTLYMQGPDRSTRVASHKFVPYGRLISRSYSKQGEFASGVRYGAVYVKFQNNGAIYRYDGVPDYAYQSFRNNISKGKFINHTLNNFAYKRVDSGDTNTSDM